METSTNPMVVAATFATEPEAMIVSGMLESNGIESFIDNSNTSSVYPMAFGSFGDGSVRLWVARNNLEKAAALIAEHQD